MTIKFYKQLPSLTSLSLIFIISLSACVSDEEEEIVLESPTLVSTANSSSHRAGEDCGICHNFTDENILNGAFTLSGTVYDYTTVGSTQPSVYNNAVVRLYSQPSSGGEEILSLPVDQSGNFYTTETIQWNQLNGIPGLYPVIQDLSNNRRVYMPQPIAPTSQVIRSTSCNFCHDHGETDPVPAGSSASTRLNIGIISHNGGEHTHVDDANSGPDCMSSSCHGPGGPDTTTTFTTAGTVYDADNPTLPYLGADTTIGLFSQKCIPNEGFCTGHVPASVKTLIEIDRDGNFYTTQPVDFAPGLYALIDSYNPLPLEAGSFRVRSTFYMDDTQTISGRCLDCHDGTTQAVITIN